jgi:hypothetical protein
MRRLILEKNNAFTSTGAYPSLGSDGNTLYFCGFTDQNSNDFIYGKLTSNNIN